VRYFPVLLALCAAALGGTPALAFKSIEGCDIVAFASASSPVPIATERWQAYRQAIEALLADSSYDARELALALAQAEQNLLAPDKASPTYHDYLADSCQLIVKLDGDTLEAKLDQIAPSLPASSMAALRQVIDAARRQMDNLDRSARFRSNQDRTLALAAYNCFVAGLIAGLLPPELRASLTLADFGDTISCQDAGRTG
jgi:hypothetical protein